jgi:hypothetical protein
MSRWYFVLLLTGMALPAMGQSPAPNEANRQPNTFVLTFKTGYVKLVDDSQTISGNDWLFERRAINVAAIEGETRLPNEARNFSLGGEVLHYQNAYRGASAPSSASGGEMYTHAFLVKSKYYFMPGSAWQPYVGGGFGLVWAYDYYAPLHTAEGLGYQGVVGMQLRTERVGLRVEYMGLRARLLDDSTGKLNASSYGLFVGLSFFFGRGGRSRPNADNKGIEVPRYRP